MFFKVKHTFKKVIKCSFNFNFVLSVNILTQILIQSRDT